MESGSKMTPSTSTSSRGILTPAVLISLALVYVIWSSTYLALRYVVEVLPPFLSSGARYFTAGVVLFAVLCAKKERLPSAREWLAALPGGVLLFVLGNGFVALAEQRGVSSSVAAVAIGIMPVFATLLAMQGGERPTVRQWSGLGLGLCGLVLMGMGDLRATPSGLLILLLAAGGWALGSHLTRRLPVPKGLMAAATQMIMGGIAMMLVGSVIGETVPSSPLSLPWRALLSFAYLVVFGSLVAFSAFTYLLRNTSASVATSYAYVNPLIAVAMGIFIGKETVAPSTIASAVLVVVGVAFIILKASPPMTRTPAPQATR
jgi:drug/metabolite transporter (DMT)-like permease